MKIKIQTITYIYLFIILASGYIYELYYFYLALVIHELGHIIMILLFKKKIEQLEISPIGGILFINGCQNDRNYKEFLIYLGGPLASGLYYFYVMNQFDNYLLIQSAFYIFILNLIPIYPLDGARLIRIFFQEVIWYKLAMKISMILSIVVSFVLIYRWINNYFYVAILLFFLFKNLEAYYQIGYDYHSFLVYKYLYPNPKLHIKVIEHHYYKCFYKGYNNYNYENGQIISEENKLNSLLSKNNY